MAGPSAYRIEGASILWADANLEKVEMTYDEVTLLIEEDAGPRKLLHCLGYLGVQMVGFWDEAIIEKAVVYSEHSFIADCERGLERSPPSGTKTRQPTGNRLLEVVFIDGCRLWVCANRFSCEQVP